MTAPTKRRWFRFGLGTLLVVVTCVAAFFAGARAGYLRGFVDGEIHAHGGPLVVMVYDVGDLTGSVRPHAELTSLCQLVSSSINPHTWETAGGTARIDTFHGDQPRLVVTQTREAHEQIVELLGGLRRHVQKRRAAGQSQ